MINCHTTLLTLELKDITNVTIQNCTFGNWTFRQVQNIFIENVTNIFNEGISTSLNFYNSSAFIENMTIEHENITGHLKGIFVQDYSILYIEQSKFVNNTVKHGLIKVLNLSYLIMSKCTALGNYAEEDAAFIYANTSFVNLTNTYLQNNNANRAGGAIFAETLSRLQIENCTFRNNEANLTGGAIHLAYFSEAHLLNVYFSRNTANIGAVIHLAHHSTLNANYLFANQNRALIGGVTEAIGSCNISCKNCFLFENFVEHKSGAAIQIFNNSIVFVSDLRCLRLMGNLYSCIYTKFNCTVFVHNSTFAMNTGSVIALWANSHLFTNNSKFLNNSTPTMGGAIMSQDNNLINVSYSLFISNKALLGGAIYQETSTTKLKHCSFFENFDSALVGFSNNDVSIEDSYFENNMGQHFGGVVSMLIHGVLNVSHTTFKNNNQNSTIFHQAFDTNGTQERGGAAILLYQSVGKISKSGFYNNHASSWGGTISVLVNSSLSVSDTTLKNNVAGVFGGAIFCYQSYLNVEYGNLINNNVINKEKGRGGGLFLTRNCTAKISNVLFSECHASNGGAIAANFTKMVMADSSLTANTGPAIFLIDRVPFEINNCTFLNNSSPVSGGAIFCPIYCDVKMVNSNFSRNRAVVTGGAISVRKFNRMSKLTVHKCSFTYNTAYSGGAISTINSDISISDSTYSNNIATEGGVVELNGNIVMANCHIINNTAHSNGGVVKAVNGSLKMSNFLVSNNTANTNGGVVFSQGITISITNCTFKMNSALAVGGVFFVAEASILMRNSSFVNNFAGLSGGIFFVAYHSVINITQLHCSANQAKQSGGVLISKYGTKAFISDTEISQNSGRLIGAIWIDDNSVLELNGSHFVNNSAHTTTGAL